MSTEQCACANLFQPGDDYTLAHHPDCEAKAQWDAKIDAVNLRLRNEEFLRSRGWREEDGRWARAGSGTHTLAEALWQEPEDQSQRVVFGQASAPGLLLVGHEVQDGVAGGRPLGGPSEPSPGTARSFEERFHGGITPCRTCGLPVGSGGCVCVENPYRILAGFRTPDPFAPVSVSPTEVKFACTCGGDPHTALCDRAAGLADRVCALETENANIKEQFGELQKVHAQMVRSLLSQISELKAQILL